MKPAHERHPPNSEALPMVVRKTGDGWVIRVDLFVRLVGRSTVEIVGAVDMLTEDEARCLATALKLASQALELRRGEK